MNDYKAKILVVDDEPSQRKMLKANLSLDGYQVFEAEDGADAIARVSEEFFDLILMDNRMTHVDGIEALKEIKKISPGIPVIIITAFASVETAIQALQAGAHDYLTKPLEIDELRIKVQQTLEFWRLKEDNILQRRRIENLFDASRIVGRSERMKHILETVAMVAPTEASVLILGESGTGKELIANALHQGSNRADKRFIKVNCAALPETLLESELFGHEKGAFTGAVGRRPGRFELADGGTIFLDEIGEMTPATQAKLLRVLQEREFEPLGSTRTVKVNIRIIAASNRILKNEVMKGTFRGDLFYRLNVVSIELPPLRERREDIPLLIEHFLRIYNEKNNRNLKGFHPRALDALMRYSWPGNIRELENVVERSVILTSDEYVPFSELPEAIRGATEDTLMAEARQGIRPGMTIREMERELIIKTLEDNDGNRTRTSRVLGITRRTLQLKLKEYGIDQPGTDSAQEP
jgi:two-component system response regulator HydG|uniref:Sigma-54-dependent Fis family transcriptional regulator n=1 Tax=Desulfomonile tiedjei TaxID=2358 RepID=A0A7C4AR07_9BACT